MSYPVSYGESSHQEVLSRMQTLSIDAVAFDDSSHYASPMASKPSSVTTNASSTHRRDSAISSAKSSTRKTARGYEPPPRTSRSSSHSSVRRQSLEERSPAVSPHRKAKASFGSITVPKTSRADAIALHERSCQLFRTGSIAVAPSNPPAPHHPYSDPSSPVTTPRPNLSRTFSSPIPERNLTLAETFKAIPPSSPAADLAITPAAPSSSAPLSRETSEKLAAAASVPDSFAPATIMHWNTLETRKREQAEIDRSNRRLRRFFRKVVPFVKFHRIRFYNDADGGADRSDVGSVRRYRLDLEKETVRVGLPSSHLSTPSPLPSPSGASGAKTGMVLSDTSARSVRSGFADGRSVHGLDARGVAAGSIMIRQVGTFEGLGRRLDDYWGRRKLASASWNCMN